MALYNSKINDNTVTVEVEGRIDSTNAAEFEAAVLAADTAEQLVIDIERLEYISSAGLRVFLKFRKKHADLEIVNASTEVYDILDMTGFTEMINVKRAYRRVSVEGCEIIGQGANGAVYRTDPDTVVKVYLNPNSLAEIEHEREVAKKALLLGIPTAISYDVVKVGDHYASMFEMLNAKSFSNLLAESPEKVGEYAEMYVDLMKQIHATEVPAGQLPDQREAVIGWLDLLDGALPAETLKKLRVLFEAIPHSNMMIHGDYHTKNIMLQNDEVILIDMDTLAVGHPILEFSGIYNAYLGFSALDKRATSDFLGFPYETAVILWKETLRLYYGTDDENVLALREKQAKTVGLTRLLRRCIRTSHDTALADYCRKELITLAQELDSLV